MAFKQFGWVADGVYDHRDFLVRYAIRDGNATTVISKMWLDAPAPPPTADSSLLVPWGSFPDVPKKNKPASAHRFELNWDLDGVLANFHSHVETLIGVPLSQITHNDELWERLLHHPRLFRDIPPFPEMVELFTELRAVYPTRIITARPRRDTMSHAEPDKRDWVHKHLGDVDTIVCLARDKQTNLKNRDGITEILIDDMPSNIKRWEAAGGVGILHTDYQTTFDRLTSILNAA